MGLDMFLDGVKYISAYEKNEEGKLVKVRKRQIVKTLEVDWRKANAIHRFFVEHVQNGEDDCKSYEIDIETLMMLRDICKKILNSNNQIKVAKELLPTQEGFFFGSTDYDDFYFIDVKDTYNEMNRLIENKEEYDWFEYSSSW